MDLKTEVGTQIPVIAGKAATTASVVTYSTGLGLWVGSAMQWLNENAGAIGVVIALVTALINLYYQRKNSRYLKNAKSTPEAVQQSTVEPGD